jgi:hypothetical protein
VVEAAKACVVDAQAAGNAIFVLWIDVFEEPGGREGWYRARCDHVDCEWTTTGAEPVVEEAAYVHLTATHGDLLASADAAVDTVRHVLRLRVGELLEGPASPPASPLPPEQPPVEALATDGAGAQGEAQGAAEVDSALSWVSAAAWIRADARSLNALLGDTTPTPRVWNAGDPEPEGVEKVRDADGDDWDRDAEKGLWCWTDVRDGATSWANWDLLAHFGDGLTEVLPEPAPKPDGEVSEAVRAGEAPVVCPDFDAPCEPLCDFCTAEVRAGEAQERTEGLDAAIEAAAEAISRYDWDHQLSANGEVSRHQRAEAAAAVRAASPLIERAALLAAADDLKAADWSSWDDAYEWLRDRAGRTVARPPAASRLVADYRQPLTEFERRAGVIDPGGAS